MARSFWSRRKESINNAGTYIKATEAVSRPTAFIMTVLGILVIGGLFFGVFWGARWSFEKLSNSGNNDKGSSSVAVNTQNPSNSSNGSNSPSASKPVTETSSTSTTAPSTPSPVTTPATIPATTNSLPHTGPGSTTAFFFAVMLISYVIYRKKLLKE